MSVKFPDVKVQPLVSLNKFLYKKLVKRLQILLLLNLLLTHQKSGTTVCIEVRQTLTVA